MALAVLIFSEGFASVSTIYSHSNAGTVIQANGRLRFEDNLRSGGFHFRDLPLFQLFKRDARIRKGKKYGKPKLPTYLLKVR